MIVFSVASFINWPYASENIAPHLGSVQQIWYLSPMRAAKVQASLHIRAVSPEPPLLTHTSSESRGTFRQKARSLALLNGWACAVKIIHDRMLEDTNLLGAPHFKFVLVCMTEVTVAQRSMCIWVTPWENVSTGVSDQARHKLTCSAAETS